MNPDTDFAPRALLGAIAFLFLSSALPIWLDKGFRHARAVQMCAAGLCLLLLGIFWPSLASVIGPRLSTSIVSTATDSRVWLALLFLVWVYWASFALILLFQRNRMMSVIESDLIPFRQALERWVIPRRLTPGQRQMITEHLRKFKPFAVTFEVKDFDDEADSYMSDLHFALGRGGWTILKTNRVNGVRPGLSIHATYPQAIFQASQAGADPMPDRVLSEALKLAGVEINNSSSGSGSSQTESIITVGIGSRKRDRQGHSQNWAFLGGGLAKEQ